MISHLHTERGTSQSVVPTSISLNSLHNLKASGITRSVFQINHIELYKLRLMHSYVPGDETGVAGELGGGGGMGEKHHLLPTQVWVVMPADQPPAVQGFVDIKFSPVNRQ